MFFNSNARATLVEVRCVVVCVRMLVKSNAKGYLKGQRSGRHLHFTTELKKSLSLCLFVCVCVCDTPGCNHLGRLVELETNNEVNCVGVCRVDVCVVEEVSGWYAYDLLMVLTEVVFGSCVCACARAWRVRRGL